MKIESPFTAPALPSDVPERKRMKPEETSPGQKPSGTFDRVEISPEAAALRSAADANRVAAETRELVATGNKEALVARPIDLERLQDLLRSLRSATASGATAG